MRNLIILSFLLVITSCVSTKNTIQNIDDNAILPQIVEGQFLLTETATDSKYGYSEF